MAENEGSGTRKKSSDDDSQKGSGSSTRSGAAKKTSSSTPRKRTSSGGSAGTTRKRASSSSGSTSRKSASSGSSGGRSRRGAAEVTRSAREQLTELMGRSIESVVGVARSEDGWTVEFEVVETRRIPDTTDVLAVYEVELDESGDVQGYHRKERYLRGSPEGTGGRR